MKYAHREQDGTRNQKSPQPLRETRENVRQPRGYRCKSKHYSEQTIHLPSPFY
jgi:hypothetical protein